MPSDRHDDYLSVIYNEQDRPLTEYPEKLARYLSHRYGLTAGMEILDLGCGRGEFLKAFFKCGLKGCGLDRFTAAKSLFPEATFGTIRSGKGLNAFQEPDL